MLYKYLLFAFLLIRQAYAFNKDLTHQEFDDVIDTITNIYEPIIDQQGAIFFIDGIWDDMMTNAFAHRPRPYVWQIDIYGELARHPLMTKDCFAFILCHEVGHHLGGAPKDHLNTWASSEGQADYFASARCLKKVFTNSNADNWKPKLSPSILQRCYQNYSQQKDIDVCARIIQAGEVFGKIMADYNQIDAPNIEFPDASVVTETIDSYPSLQCRLDTIIAGALCQVDLEQQPDDFNPLQGFCNNPAGIRPTCWYKEN